jgi:AcrR family transcriptional regulator
MDSDFFHQHETAACILEEGWQLFQQKGYRGVTIDELCLRCKLSKPTLYYYFQDKENLFVQILQYKLRGFREVIEQPGTLRARLEGIAASILASFQTEYNNLLRDREHLKKPENLERIRAAFHDQLFTPLIALMQSGIDSAELRPEQPGVLALIFMGSINNFIGKAADLHTDNQALAKKLTAYFIEGARNQA